MRTFRILGWLGTILIIAVAALTAKAQDDPNFEMGLKPYGSYHGGNIDKVNLGNGGLTVEIPLISYPQRGDKLKLDFSLIYQNKSGYVDDVCVDDGEGDESCWFQTSGTVGSFTFVDKDSVFPLENGWGGCLNEYPYTYCDFQLQDSDGAVHQLAPGGSGLWVSVDATGYRVPSGTAYDNYFDFTSIINRQGTQYTVASPGSGPCFDGDLSNELSYPVYPYTLWGSTNITCAPSRIDTNGNQITVSASTGWTDSVGRTIPPPTTSTTATGGCTGSQTTAYVALWSPPSVAYANGGNSSGNYPLKFCYFYDTEPFTPDNSVYGLYTIAGASHLQSVVLPNGTAWTFQYTTDGLYNLSQITLPTGGTISYSWGRTGNCDDFHLDVYNAAVIQRVMNPSDGGPSVTSNYSYNVSPSIYTKVTEVSSAGNNDSVHTFGMGSCALYETKEQDYNGLSSGGSLMKTVDTTYSYVGSPIFGSPAPWEVVPTQVNTTLNDTGQENEVQTTYDSNLGFWDPVFAAPTPIYSEMTGNTYGNVIAKSEYDFGGGSPLRITSTGYQAFSSSYYLGKNLLDLPSYVEVTDGGSTEHAYTTYSYDESSYSPSGCTPTTPCGNLTTVERYKDGSNHVDTHTTYSSYGMPTLVIDPNGNHTCYSYDSTGTFVTEIQYPTPSSGGTCSSSLVEYFSYDTNTGLKISHTDENSQVTTFKYDEMERLTNVYYPDTGSDAYVYTDSATPNPYFTFTKAITSSSNLVETGVVDGLGRKRHTEVNSDPAGTDYVDYSYDDRGRLYSVSNPHRSGTSSTDGTRYYSYDPLNRVQTVTEQDGSTISTSYSGSYATVTEEAGKVRKSYADGLGRMAGVWEDPSGLNYETDYSYDTLNNLTGVTQKGGASSSYWRTRTFEYDWLSRLTSATNPESGTTTYTYDANGNVVTKVAPQANQTGSSTTTTTYSYDARNRLSTKTYSDGTAGSYYYYDLTSTWGLSVSNPIGRLVAENTWSSGSSWITARGFSYDAMGRVVRTVYCTPAHCNDSPYPSPYWTATYSYDLAGDLTSLGYPSGRTITYGINAAKQTTSAVDSAYSINYATSAAYTPPGELASLANGSSLISTLFYNSRLQPCRISVKSTGSVPGSCTVSSDAGNVVDLTYNFNLGTADNGNVMKVSDNRTGMSGRNGNYTYDALNRIASAYTDATTGSYCWGETYQIDPWANLYTIAGKSTHSACTQESGLSLSGYINGSNQITLSGFGYDAAGNVTSTGTVSQKYDGENRICSVGGTNCTSGTTYTYDAKGQRIRKSSGTSYLYGVNDEVLTELNSSEAVSNEYIFFDGNRIARRDSSGNVDYYFSDHLGTARVVTNSSGTIQDDSDFYPYGGQRIISSASGNTYKFTGKERDSESGLDNFGARYNSSQYGRFMSPDPGPWIFLNPQSYNAYSYGLNNPLRYSDDSGMTAQDRVNEANLLASQNIDYVTGGKNPSCGLDCSGLVQNVFKADPDNTIPILDTVQSAATQATDLENSGQYSTDINQAQSGDAIFFSDPSSGKIVHTGIIVDIRNGKVYFVHAPKPGYKVGKNFVDIKKLKFGNEKFAGIGRPIEPVRSQTNTTNSSNPLSNAYNWLSNFVEQRFFNQQPQQQQEQVTTRIVDCQKEPNNPGCPQ